jgi:hypothetical protein
MSRRGMIEITAIRLGDGFAHEHVTDVMWRSSGTSQGLTSRQATLLDRELWSALDGALRVRRSRHSIPTAIP